MLSNEDVIVVYTSSNTLVRRRTLYKVSALSAICMCCRGLIFSWVIPGLLCSAVQPPTGNCEAKQWEQGQASGFDKQP